MSCSKTDNCGVDGNWTLYKKVNNRTGETIIYPDDSCFRYIISNNKAKVYKHTNISDSFMYERDVDCNYIFFQTKDSFQYGYLWNFVAFKKY